MRSDPTPVRILLLEDSDIDADLLLAYLRSAGSRCVVDRALRRADYEAALEGAAPDLVLADYSLPDFDGLTALRMTRAAWPGVPFVFVSGVLGEDIALQALRLGATDYVLKRNLAALPGVIERALAETHERSSRERAEMLFRLAAEAAGIGVWELDAEHQTLRLDEGMRALLGIGLQPVSTLGPMIELLVHEQDRELVRRHIERAIGPDTDGEFEYVHRALHQRSGRICWLTVKGRRVTGLDGRARLVGTARDVTAERQRDEALLLANSTLERRIVERTRERDRIWNLSLDLMHVCTPDGSLVAVNPAWHRLLGWTARQLLDSRLTDWVHGDDREATERALALLAKGRPLPALDNRIVHANGSTRWIRWTATADDGLVYAVGRDVTEERARLHELAEINQQLKAQVLERSRVEATLQQMQRLEAVGQLTSGVAHDFNNLLAVVLSNINLVRMLLQRQPVAVDERITQRLQAMERASQRGSSLIAQLLAFSRRQRLEPSVIDLNDVLRGMRDLLQTTMGGTIQIEMDLHTPLWHALADPTQLELIVLNLAINSRDAMEVGGRLTIRTRNVCLTEQPVRDEEPEPGNYVQLSVSDSGSGIAPEVLSRVFEPFFTTKDVGKGSGLGLAQVYGFAKQSGGGLRLETKLGHGTSVHVYIPQAAPGEAASEAPGARLAGAGDAAGAQRKLLLVDDDEDVRDATAELLALNGYRVVQASHAAQALECVDAHPDIDLVLADFAMPGVNGADLRRLLLRKRPALPVVIVTGYADLSALQDLDERMVLQKPVQIEALLEGIRRWLAGPIA